MQVRYVILLLSEQLICNWRWQCTYGTLEDREWMQTECNTASLSSCKNTVEEKSWFHVQIFSYGAWTFLMTGVMELYCRTYYLNAFVRSGVWERAGKLLGNDLTGTDMLALSVVNLAFVYLKVSFPVQHNGSFWSNLIASKLWQISENMR